MAKKKNHMTKKHEYAPYKRRHSDDPSLDVEGEEIRYTKSKYAKYRKKRDMQIKKRLRTILEYSDGIFDEEYDE